MQNMKKKNYLLYLLLLQLPIISYGQESLQLENCTDQQFAINDHSDSDNDGNVCEAKIVISNSASYTNNFECGLSNIKWTVTVDLFNDGSNDIEYSSSLPSNDNTLDDTNGNGIPDLYIAMTTNNEIQSIPIPDIDGGMSNHKITWSVSDDCDLGDLCVANFTVMDKKSPNSYCVALSTAIFNGFEFEVFAEDFNVGSFDNCTDMENLRFSFSGDSIVPTRLITCNDVVNSPVVISMYVWDDFDNVDYCIVHLTVLPEPFVDCVEVYGIAGEVIGWKGYPIEGVEIKLEANLPQFPLIRYTDSDGKYSFGVLPNNVDYSLSASFDDSYLTGASTLDFVMIIRHILGIQSFLNPYQIIAADINGDYKIKANDLILLRKLILGVITEYTTNTAWTFLRSDFEFTDPANPFPSLINSNEDPFIYEFNAIDIEGYDFIGTKTGDVNN